MTSLSPIARTIIRKGWVTEFINRLNREIKSTFKEEISIYFDQKPFDGLHGHYEVDDSLREKLRFLIYFYQTIKD